MHATVRASGSNWSRPVFFASVHTGTGSPNDFAMLSSFSLLTDDGPAAESFADKRFCTRLLEFKFWARYGAHEHTSLSGSCSTVARSTVGRCFAIRSPPTR